MPHIENDRPITRVVISYGENYYRTIVLDAEFIRKKYSREFFTFNSISIVFLLFYLFIFVGYSRKFYSQMYSNNINRPIDETLDSVFNSLGNSYSEKRLRGTFLPFVSFKTGKRDNR